MRISDRIKELRTERGLSQTKLASSINSSQRSVSSWESGEHEPTATNIFNLAKFFGVTADYLLGLTDEWAIGKR